MNAACDTQRAVERRDALLYLPRKGVVAYRRNQVIYDDQHPCAALHLVVEGRVRVTTTLDGARIVTGILGVDEFFGELALIGSHAGRERAMAMEKTKVMSWPVEEIETEVERQTGLGMALIQVFAGRCLDLEDRLQSLAFDKTPERVAHGLLRLARRGARAADGATRMSPVTHQELSEYIGTSREIVTFNMNELRRRGLLRYSRKAIEIYIEALGEHLRCPRT
jgi:CRP-like cAMP-binding protein